MPAEGKRYCCCTESYLYNSRIWCASAALTDLPPCSRSYSRQESAQRLCRDSTILCETKVGSSSLQNTTATDLASHISNTRPAGLLLPSCGTTMPNLRKSCCWRTSSASRLPAAIFLQTSQTCKTSQMCTLARWGFSMLLLCCILNSLQTCKTRISLQTLLLCHACSSMLHIMHKC